ncbi:MAG: hypothetical protein ACYDAA_00230 [Syntrophales bacterium]
MIVNVYAHLVDEMRREEAYQLPEMRFKAKTMPRVLARNACQNKNSHSEVAANKWIIHDNNGRGGRI